LLVLGGLLALYDGAEVLLSRSLGSLAATGWVTAVLLGGLLGFAAASAVFVLADSPGLVWAARLGQGPRPRRSPRGSALVARLHPHGKRGRAFGSYGFFKSIGDTPGRCSRRRDRLGRPAAAVRGHGMLALAVAGWAAAVGASGAAATEGPADGARPGAGA